MQLEAALRSYLLTRSAIVAIVEDRIALGDAAPEAELLPDLYYEVAHSSYDNTLDGLGEDLQFPVVEITARSLRASDCLTLVGLVATALRQMPGTTITAGSETGVPVVTCDLDDTGSPQPSDEISADGTTRTVYRYSVLATLGYRPAADGVSSGESGGNSDPNLPRNSGRTAVEIVVTEVIAASQMLDLPSTPDPAHPVVLTPYGGFSQRSGRDFRVSGRRIRWDAPTDGLYGVLIVGDVLLIEFNS